MKFEEHLKKWNGGIYRGSQLRLAKSLGIDQSGIRRWMEGTTKPKEELRPKLAKLLGITVDELMASLQEGKTARFPVHEYELKDGMVTVGNAMALLSFLSEEEKTLLKKIVAQDRRDEISVVRWLIYAYGTGRLVEKTNERADEIPERLKNVGYENYQGQIDVPPDFDAGPHGDLIIPPDPPEKLREAKRLWKLKQDRKKP